MDFLLVVLAATCVLGRPGPGPYEGHQIVELTPHTSEQVEWLEDLRESGDFELDFWEGPHVGTPLSIRVAPIYQEEFKASLQEHGLQQEVVAYNVQRLVDAERQSNAAVTTTYSTRSNVVGVYTKSQPILDWMDNLARSHPSLVSIRDIGKSTEGRMLKVAKVSSGSGRPVIFINAGFHSREWIAHASVVWILNELVTQYGQDAAITALVDKFDWYIMPLANPDGYDYSHDSDRFWRKTRSRNGGCYGADPNRNWDVSFGGEGTSSNPCTDNYHGPRAFSEPESAAMAHFMEDLGEDLRMYIDVHSFSQLWMTPYGFSRNTARPSDADELDRVAKIGADAIYTVNRKRFQVGTPPQLIYAAAGGAFDWAKLKLGVKYAYALELRPTMTGFWGFLVPAREIPSSGRETLAGIAAAANAIKLQ